MHAWLRLAGWIDTVNEWVGRSTAWLVVAMVLIGAYNAVARYLGRSIGVELSSNAYIELQWYLFSLVFLLAGGYALRHNRHVRVDVLYGRLGPRARAGVNLGGTLLFLLPFCLVALWVTWPSVRNAWQVLEVSPDPGGLPRYPLRTAVLVGFLLLLAQAVSMTIHAVAVLRGHEAVVDDPDAVPMEGV